MSFLHTNLVNLHITYELDTQSRDINTGFTLGNWLFGAIKLTKSDDSDKYGYNGFANGFYARLQFSWVDGS